MTGLLSDPLAAFGLSPATNDTQGDAWSPDNWLVSQVEQMPTPPAPAAGITTRNEPHTTPAPQAASIGAGGSLGSALDAAMSKVGTMYDWGGTGTGGRGVDCSGLIYFAYRAAGYDIQRYRAVDYGHMGVAVGADAARAGDIVYFDNPNTDTDHVGIYLGNGQFIEAPQPGSKVRVSSLAGRGGVIRRILPDSAYRGLPRDSTGNVQYHAPDNKVFTSATAPGPQHDPLDILTGMDQGADVNPLLGLPADIQQGIAAQTPAAAPAAAGAPATPGGQFGSFLNAVSGQESGGNYNVVNSIGAIGKYQVMTANVGSWTLSALGHTLSPEQFRNSPAAQEAVARWKLGSLVAQYGYRGAAAAWYSGRPGRQNDYSHVGNGPSVGSYVDQVLARMGG